MNKLQNKTHKEYLTEKVRTTVRIRVGRVDTILRQYDQRPYKRRRRLLRLYGLWYDYDTVRE